MTAKNGVVATLVLLTTCCWAGCGSGGSSPGSDAGSSGGGDGGGTGGAGGASGDAGTSACTPALVGGGTVAWLDDGTPECALTTIATRMTDTGTDTMQDFFELVAASTTGHGVGLTVVSYDGPLGGTYACGSAPGTGAPYVDFVYRGTLQSCVITIQNPGTPGGANAKGTFTGTFLDAGAAVTVTSGTFDVPTMASGN